MADLMIRQSALAQLGLDGRAQRERGEAGVALAEKPFRAIVDLRGNPEDAAFLGAAQGALGLELPLTPNTTASQGKTAALWLTSVRSGISTGAISTTSASTASPGDGRG